MVQVNSFLNKTSGKYIKKYILKQNNLFSKLGTLKWLDNKQFLQLELNVVLDVLLSWY